MIQQSGNRIFLKVNGRWYFYDQSERPLGAGAMGTVYLGRDYETNELIAIKRVVDAYSSIPSIRKRAREEASLMFRHKNLVEMIGCCEAAPNAGPMFILSRLVQGITIDKHVDKFLRNRQDALNRICMCMYPVFDALTYLHSKGIVHLDIKPSNIMVENGCNVRLMDLGIAYACSEQNSLSQGLVGTPKYAAPEQIYDPEMPKMEITPSTDIYELGVTIYELLTGYNPFDSGSREETIKRQRTMILPKSVRIPAAVLEVLRKATSKSPIDRYSSAGEFKMALQKSLKKKNNNKWYIVVSIILAVLLVVLFIIQLQ